MQLSDTDIIKIHLVGNVIESRIHQGVSVKELCEASGLGESKLTRGFKLLYRTTIYQYHLLTSMKHAKSLLEQGRQVKEVALLLGYKRPEHFTRAFKKIFNQLPGSLLVKK